MTYLTNYVLKTKTGDYNLSVFNIITIINETKILTKHILCGCKYKFDGRKRNSNPTWNNNKRQCECNNLKEHHVKQKRLYLESYYM